MCYDTTMQKHNPDSICQFPSAVSDSRERGLDIVNFVYEPRPLPCEADEVRNTHILYLLVAGSCTFFTDYGEYELKKGDFFFVFPHKRYRYTLTRGLRFIYISFTNIEAPQILKELGILYTSPAVLGHEELVPLFKKEFEISRSLDSAENSAKGLLYLSLGHFAGNRAPLSSAGKAQATVREIASYLETHYMESDLTLKKVGEAYYYHFNYVSQIFKEVMGVSFSKYLTGIRMRFAQTLLEQTDDTVSNIAKRVGFEDAHYFERIFKQIKGLTPSQYRALTRP